MFATLSYLNAESPSQNHQIIDEYAVRCSFVEVYQEKVWDLLGERVTRESKTWVSYQNLPKSCEARKPLRVRENDGRVFIEGVTNVCVTNPEVILMFNAREAI